jgi:hypothetical protein
MQTAGNAQLAAVPGATVVSRKSWDTIHLSKMSLHRHHIRPPLNALGKVFRLPFLAPEPGIALLLIIPSVLYSQFERCRSCQDFRVSRFEGKD